LLYQLVETPFMRLRSRWFPAVRTVAETGPVQPALRPF